MFDQGFLPLVASTMLLNGVFVLEAVEVFLIFKTLVDALFLVVTSFLETALLKEDIPSSSC